MKFYRFINITILAFFIIIVLFSIGVISVFWKYSSSIPDYSTLKEYDPPVTTRVFSSDGKLLDEFSIEERLFVPINQIPKKLINAFLSAEDKNFYDHKGVDFFSIINLSIIESIECLFKFILSFFESFLNSLSNFEYSSDIFSLLFNI